MESVIVNFFLEVIEEDWKVFYFISFLLFSYFLFFRGFFQGDLLFFRDVTFFSNPQSKMYKLKKINAANQKAIIYCGLLRYA